VTASHDLARAISNHAARHARQNAHRTFYARILQLDPLQAEVTTNRLMLDEDDIVLSQGVRRYDYDYGLEVGDTLLVSQMPNDDFLAHDVVTQYPTLEGADSTTPSDANYQTSHGKIVAAIDVTDSDGNVIGQQPVYDAFRDTPMPTTVSYTSRNGHIVAQIAVTDAGGNIVGYSPVYSALSSDAAPT
jgi:hypothetical protein